MYSRHHILSDALLSMVVAGPPKGAISLVKCIHPRSMVDTTDIVPKVSFVHAEVPLYLSMLLNILTLGEFVLLVCSICV